jgi:hypothetical protein
MAVPSVLEIEPTFTNIQATMTENKKKAKKGKRDLYWEDAQSLFLAGKELEEIKDLVPVTLPSLKKWHQEGQWEEKRR